MKRPKCWNVPNYMTCPVCGESTRITWKKFEMLYCEHCKALLVKFVKGYNSFLKTLVEYRDLEEY